MAVRFSYMVQQPDGSVGTEHSEAERPPTWGQLAGYVSSQGGTLLPATPAAQPPRATATPPPPPAAAPPAAPGIAATTLNTLLPERTFTSQLPEIAGATAAGAATSAVGGPWLAPFGAGAGASAGEAARVGA